MNTWVKANWLSVVAIIMVLVATREVPYFAYYQITNWVVVGAALMAAWRAYKQGAEWVSWLMAAVIIVFNPIAPLYLTPQAWRIVDVAGAIVLASTFFSLKS